MRVEFLRTSATLAMLVIAIFFSTNHAHAQHWGYSSYASHVSWTGTGIHGSGYGSSHAGYSTWGYNWGGGSGYDCCGSHSGHHGGYSGNGGCGRYSHAGYGGHGCGHDSFHERSYEWGSMSDPQPPAPPVPEEVSAERDRQRRAVVQVRIWKDLSGKTLAEGRAFVVADGCVGISKVAGGTLTLLIADLASSDRDYLAARVSDPSLVAETSATTDPSPRVASR